MKNTSSIGVDIRFPAVFVQKNDRNLLVPSMVISTIVTCALITFIPQLMPLWMQLAATSPK